MSIAQRSITQMPSVIILHFPNLSDECECGVSNEIVAQGHKEVNDDDDALITNKIVEEGEEVVSNRIIGGKVALSLMLDS